MSFQALAWAASQKTGGMAAKSVLLALANYADEHGCAYPSTAALAAFGEMDHKTATAALDRLIEAGLIADTGDRAGRTRQVKVYQLSLSTIPKPEAYQNRKPSVFSEEAPQKRGTDTVKEPKPQKTTSSSVRRTNTKTKLPDDFEPALTAAAAEKADSLGADAYRAEVEKFKDHHRSKGSKFEDWQAAFRTWLSNAAQWKQERQGRNGNGHGNRKSAWLADLE